MDKALHSRSAAAKIVKGYKRMKDRKARGIEEFESDIGHGGLDEDEAIVMTSKKKKRARLK